MYVCFDTIFQQFRAYGSTDLNHSNNLIFFDGETCRSVFGKARSSQFGTKSDDRFLSEGGGFDLNNSRNISIVLTE